jgi:hypothetical protein
MQFLSRITPAKASFVFSRRQKDGSLVRTVHNAADPEIGICGHMLLSLLFYGALIAYIVLTSIDFATGTPPTENSMAPTDTLPFAELDVSFACLSGTCGDVLLVENYTRYPSSACFDEVSDTTPRGVRSRNMTPGEAYRVALCFTDDEEFPGSALTAPLPVSMVQTSFLDLRGFASVTVRGVGDDTQRGTLNRELAVDRGLVRGLHIAATVELRDDEDPPTPRPPRPPHT